MSYQPNNPNGQTTSANSAPVVIASDQTAIPVTGNQQAVSTTAWTSATALNTATTITITNMNTVSVTMSNTSTMTGGVLTFEVSPDGGTSWFPIAMARIDSYTVETVYTLNTVANRAWTSSVDSFTNFRVRLSTVIVGTGTATIKVGAQVFAIEPIATVGQSVAANLQATVTGTVAVSSGTVFAKPSLPVQVFNQTTTNTTQVQLTATSYAPTNGVLIQALAANTGKVYIGLTGVTTSTGFELQAGQSITVTPTNANLIYTIGSNATDKVCWLVG